MRAFRTGSYNMLFALCTPVFLGLAGSGVDLGLRMVAQAEAQAAADGAAIAAVFVADDLDEASRRASAYVAEYRVNSLPVTLDPESSMQVFYWDGEEARVVEGESPNAISLTVEVDVPTMFLGFFGVREMRVRASSTAARAVTTIQGRSPDVVVAIDATGSMDGPDLDATKEAAMALVDCFRGHSDGSSMASIVSFSDHETIHTEMMRYEEAEDYEEIEDAVHGLMGRGGTNHGAGLAGARHVLESTDFPSDSEQIVVLMSDGEPNYFGGRLCMSEGNAERVSSHWDAESYCPTDLENPPSEDDTSNFVAVTHAVEESGYREAERIREMGAEIYTVYYNAEAHVPGGYGKTYLEDLSSGPEYAFASPNREDIEDLFMDICSASLTRSYALPGLIEVEIPPEF